MALPCGCPWHPRDHEVYAWLRACLPRRYEIRATPESNYLAHTRFDYHIHEGERCIARWCGDLSEYPSGGLAERAVETMHRLSRGEP